MIKTGVPITGSSQQSDLVGDPVIEQLDHFPEMELLMKQFSDLESLILFDSRTNQNSLGRYSFLTADPSFLFQIQKIQYGEDPFRKIRAHLDQFRVKTIPGLPPFQGGCAGYLGYELGNAWEKYSSDSFNEFEMPDLVLGIYDWVIALDYQEEKAWVISQGFPETEESKRKARARDRLEFVKKRIHASESSLKNELLKENGEKISADQLAPQWAVSEMEGLTSDISREDYLEKVERVIEYILAGDIFQANLSQRLLFPLKEQYQDLYLRLRKCNPAPFAGYFAHDDWAILSASPERFLEVDDRKVTTRPIKGTRHRRTGPEADLFTRDELRESIKDRAENVMIVDLLRNDLSRVCSPHTVSVPELCRVESYETVQHLVSEVCGTLRPDQTIWDLFQAAFPGGSITGAPKVRAMEIISELEPTVRGPYCGSLMYHGFDGRMDSNILIRTFTCRKGWVQCPVGGGITAKSDPQDEYQETMDKAEGMLRALKG